MKIFILLKWNPLAMNQGEPLVMNQGEVKIPVPFVRDPTKDYHLYKSISL